MKLIKNEKTCGGLKDTAKFLGVISEEKRLEILCLLKKREMCVCEIWRHLQSSQNLTSHHLKVLKDFGLISSRKDGLKVFYKLNKSVVKKYIKLLNKFI